MVVGVGIPTRERRKTMKGEDLLTAFVGRRADTVRLLVYYIVQYGVFCTTVQCFRILIADTGILEEN